MQEQHDRKISGRIDRTDHVPFDLHRRLQSRQLQVLQVIGGGLRRVAPGLGQLSQMCHGIGGR